MIIPSPDGTDSVGMKPPRLGEVEAGRTSGRCLTLSSWHLSIIEPVLNTLL